MTTPPAPVREHAPWTIWLTAIAFEAATVLFGAFNTAYTNGSSLIGLFSLVFGALALIVVLMGPSIHWCSK
ncbi:MULTISPECIES: hypothetical protein [Glycomyces]|uniref:Uncharacterized BrkB/YihY/UPF0761 family membrane protein n=2 Tax=Glycomyces TaxID=58113 RepID=A0A9X3PQ26_9ACTN|nr:hypothetical protein [Glycomyces lechevalierae]MDA1388031.1 hypothetical protein [Glycomyces lechevalierae]MDR7338798.1 uncharacterized BrkB/YihY/UPF0761 family membrane protein [Glycomyces lechevalierae]